jgi:CHAT domain-containing protein
MRCAAKWLGLVAVAAVIMPFAEMPGFFWETGELMPAALAQSTEARKAEADRLLQQGIQQAQVSQFREAIQAWEQALALYREIQDLRGEVQILSNLGAAYYILGDYRRTIESMEQGLAIFRRLGDRVNEANALDNLGLAYRDLEDYPRAIEFYGQSLAIFRELGDQDGEGYALLNLGLAHSKIGDYRLAIEFYEQSLPIFRELGDQDGEGNALNNLGFAYRNLENYRLAIEFYGQSLIIFRELGDRRSEGVVLRNLSTAHHSIGDYRRAIEYDERALVIARELDDRRNEGVTLGNLGRAHDSIGEYRRALGFHEQHLAIARELDDRAHEGAALGSLGSVYLSLGDYHQAINFYEQALTIALELEDRANEGAVLGNLGNAYLSLGDYRRAIEYHEQHLAIARELSDRAGEGRALNSLGGSYLRLDNYGRAIDLHEQALAIARDIGNPYSEGIALGNLGNVYWSLGDYRRAINFYEESLAIARETGDRLGERNALGNLGNVYLLGLKNYPRAISFHEQSLAIAREIEDRTGEGTTLGNLGLAYWILGDHQQAIAFHQQSLAIARDIGDRRGEGGALNNLGMTYRSLGQEDRALEFYSQALPIFNALGSRAEAGRTLGNIGKLLNAQAQPELAITFLKASVDVRESIRGDIRSLDTALQQSFTDTVADDYRLLADLLLLQNRILEAQRVLDLLKVQELDESLRGVRSTSDTSGGVAFWQMETDLLTLYNQVLTDADELAQLQAADYDSLSPAQQQRLQDLRQRNTDVQRRFTAFLDLPEVRQLLAQIRQETEGQNLAIETQHRALQNNLRRLPQRTALLYPLILPDRLELVLVTADGPPLRYPITVKGEELNRAIVAFGQALKDPSSDIQPLAQQLYGWLVAPLEDALAQAGIESLLYAPDGALRYLPLGALHDGEQYLAQRFSLSHITAASLTNFDQVPNADRRRLLAAACAECSFTITVGGATFPFGDLPYTETEVKALAQQVPNTSVLLNRGFSRSELENRLGSYSIIHLATHGAMVENAPSQSFVVLGSGEHVSLEAIRQDWNLSHAELVVLSACETAVGSPELGSGVEILGLGYQIQEAGALGVLASLWKVSDQGTQILMNAFYAALQEEGVTKASALQAAQVALITGDFSAVGGQRASIEVVGSRTGQPGRDSSDLSHPYYWAPFILIGNGL